MSCDCEGLGLKGRVVVVTGAASGIGFGCARFLSEMGASVALFDVDEAKGAAAAGQLGGNARFFRTDVRCEKSCRESVEGVKEAFGRIDAEDALTAAEQRHSQALSDVESRVRREVAEEIAQAITDIDPRAVAHADGGWWQGFADGQAVAVRRARLIGGAS